MSTGSENKDEVLNSPEGAQPEYVPVEVVDLRPARQAAPRKPRFATRPGWSTGLAMVTSFVFVLLTQLLSGLYGDYQGRLLLSSVVADLVLLVSMFLALTAYCGNGFAEGDSVRFNACVAIVVNLVAMVFVQGAIFVSLGTSQAHRQRYPTMPVEKPEEPVRHESRDVDRRDFYVPPLEHLPGSRSGSR